MARRDPAAYARDEGDMADLARAVTAIRPLPNSGTAPRLMANSVVHSLGAIGAGLLAGAPGSTVAGTDAASPSAQPLTTIQASGGFSADPAARPAQPSNQYAQIGHALKAVAAGQQKQGQQKAGGMPLAQPYKPSPIGLRQAQSIFDPARFYGALRNAGARGV